MHRNTSLWPPVLSAVIKLYKVTGPEPTSISNGYLGEYRLFLLHIQSYVDMYHISPNMVSVYIARTYSMLAYQICHNLVMYVVQKWLCVLSGDIQAQYFFKLYMFACNIPDSTHSALISADMQMSVISDSTQDMAFCSIVLLLPIQTLHSVLTPGRVTAFLQFQIVTYLKVNREIAPRSG